MKVRSTIVSLVVTLISASAAFAHGDKTHIMGTVSTLDAGYLVVKDREGKPISIRLSKETKYQTGDAPAAAGDLKVGDRVVVDVGDKGDSLIATEVRFSSPASPCGHEGPPRHQGHE
jgi:hypothetical protein